MKRRPNLNAVLLRCMRYTRTWIGRLRHILLLAYRYIGQFGGRLSHKLTSFGRPCVAIDKSEQYTVFG